MHKFGLIGYPLGHSFSPKIHNLIYELNGIDATYSLNEINPEELNKDTFENISQGFNGFNVTIPYKTEIMKYLDEVSEEAQQIGAVNTLKKVGNQWVGYNTDLNGFLYPLENYLNRIESCLVIGAGGAAKAVIYTILKKIKPKQLNLLARKKEKLESLKLLFGNINSSTIIGKDYITNIKEYLGRADLIVNATSVGMHPNINESVFSASFKLKKNTIVYDLIYNPLETKLLNNVKKTNPDCIIINGLPMLIAQAVKSVEIWTGKSISVENTINALDISNLLH